MTYHWSGFFRRVAIISFVPEKGGDFLSQHRLHQLTRVWFLIECQKIGDLALPCGSPSELDILGLEVDWEQKRQHIPLQ